MSNDMMNRHRCFPLFVWALAASASSSQVAFASSILTARSTQAALNSLRLLPDGTVLYSGAYGVYRVRGQQIDTLLTNPVQPSYYDLFFPGGFCLHCAPAIYHLKSMAADPTIYAAEIHPGQTVTMYVTGLNISRPIAPPYDVTQPTGMQVVLGSYGYLVLQPHPFSPSVFELTMQLPSDLPSGELPIRLFSGFMSTEPTSFSLSGGN